MDRLTATQRDALKSALEARASLLREGIDRALDQRGDGTKGLANHSEETDDDAIVDQEATLDAALLERNATEMSEVTRALERLGTPEFGQCADCGTGIPFARLQANPMALRCTACQSAHERAYASPGHPTL